MDVQTLRLFRDVAEGATVTETAARAHLTQPALSRALRRLEHDAGAEGDGLERVPHPGAHLDQPVSVAQATQDFETFE